MNPFKNLKSLKVTLFAAFLSFIVVPLTVIPIILFYVPLWICVILLAKYFRPDLDSPVTSFNTMFQLHQTKINCIGCIGFNGRVQPRNLIKPMEDRILNLRNSGGELAYLGLQRSYTKFLGYAFWKRDSKFKLENHIRNYDYAAKLALPTPVDSNTLKEILGGLLKAPWKNSQSPWEFLLIHDFQQSGGKCGTIVLLRYDHVLADGYSMISLFNQIGDSVVGLPNFDMSTKKFLTIQQKFSWIFKIPFDTAENILEVLSAFKLHPQKKIINPEIMVGYTRKIPVQLIKDVKNHFNVSYGSVIYTILLGALERALENCGHTVPDKIATNFLTPKSNHPGQLCVHSYSLMAAWPLKSASKLDRLLQVHKNFVNLSTSGAKYTSELFIYAGSFYPTIVRTIVSKLMYRLMNQSIYLTTMPVTTSSTYFRGVDMTEIIPVNDTASSLGIGMGLTTGGCNNNLRFSYSINRGFFASDDVAHKMSSYIEEEFQELVNLMSKNQ